MKTPNWVVTNVVPMRNYTLVVSFADGTVKTVNLADMLEKKNFIRIKNPEIFMKARVECGTVVWDDELDIAPEWLYEA